MDRDPAFWSRRRVVMTGATGFVGLHTARELRKLGARVSALVRKQSAREHLTAIGVDCVLAPLDSVIALRRGCEGADILIHVAGAVDFGDSWDQCRQVNVEGTRNVITAARQAGIRRVVQVSSIVAVGGSREPTAVNEQAPWNLGRLSIPYITTKREAEHLALAANGTEMEVVAVNPGCVIGPEDFTGSEFGMLCRRFWRGRIPFYFAGGMSLVDVRDVAQGILLAAQKGEAGNRYLLTGENLLQKDFYTSLALTAGRRYLRMPLPCWVGRWGASLASLFPQRKNRRPYLSPAQSRMLGWYFYYDNTRARQHLGFTPRPLSETLSQTHSFWMKHQAA